MIVAIEGIDAAGKATVTNFLSEYLTKLKVSNKAIAFPRYDGPVGSVIKQLLKDPTSAPELKQAAMLADRLGAIDVFMEGKFGNKTIICDRYVMSGIVYGLADGLDEPWLYKMHSTLPKAELQILLDMDPEEAAKRRGKPRDANERNFKLLHKVRKTYLDIWNSKVHSYGLWHVIDASRDKESIQYQVAEAYHRAASFYTYVETSTAAY